MAATMRITVGDKTATVELRSPAEGQALVDALTGRV